MKSRLLHELKLVALVTLFFMVWFGMLIALKKLTLANYQIQFSGLSVVVIGALVTAKVVLILDHVSLGGACKLPSPDSRGATPHRILHCGRSDRSCA